MGETPVTQQSRVLKAVAIRNPISSAHARRKAPMLSFARVLAMRTSKIADGINHEVEISRAMLEQTRYNFIGAGKSYQMAPS